MYKKGTLLGWRSDPLGVEVGNESEIITDGRGEGSIATQQQQPNSESARERRIALYKSD